MTKALRENGNRRQSADMTPAGPSGADADRVSRASEPLPDVLGVPAELRQHRIVDVVEAGGFARVTDLAEMFSVSTVTVRSDLASLEGLGHLRRVRGGAVPVSLGVAEQPLELTAAVQAFEKVAIGTRAAALVSSGDVVILDVGSTTTAIAEALMARRDLRDVTVVTNALNVALRLEQAADRITVIVSGGTVRPLQHSLVNPYATLLLEQITAHLAFVGCNGVDARGGITNRNVAEAEIKRAMVRATRRAVVVADGSKLGEVEVARVCPVSDIDLLITDESADDNLLAELSAAGLALDVVGTT
jgi:DeoR family transcriptional regulator of aga operon